MKHYMANRGFTLLEILVVVSIIATLSAIAYTNLGGTRDLAADQAIMAEFRELQVALELYKNQNDTKLYPLPDTAAGCSGIVAGERYSTDDGACEGSYIQGLTPAFTSQLPSSNKSENPNCTYEYRTDVSGSWYKLTAIDCIAGGKEMTYDEELSRCPSDCPGSVSQCQETHAEFATSFAIYSDGGQCE